MCALTHTHAHRNQDGGTWYLIFPAAVSSFIFTSRDAVIQHGHHLEMSAAPLYDHKMLSVLIVSCPTCRFDCNRDCKKSFVQSFYSKNAAARERVAKSRDAFLQILFAFSLNPSLSPFLALFPATACVCVCACVSGSLIISDCTACTGQMWILYSSEHRLLLSLAHILLSGANTLSLRTRGGRRTAADGRGSLEFQKALLQSPCLGRGVCGLICPILHRCSGLATGFSVGVYVHAWGKFGRLKFLIESHNPE